MNTRRNRPEDFTDSMRRLQERTDYERTPDGGAVTNQFYAPPQPDFNTPEMIGSMQKILSENIGKYVVIEFLIGTGEIMRKQGMLYLVGVSYVTLYDEREDVFIVCDIFSIKFVYFLVANAAPQYNFNRLTGDRNGNRR